MKRINLNGIKETCKKLKTKIMKVILENYISEEKKEIATDIFHEMVVINEKITKLKQELTDKYDELGIEGGYNWWRIDGVVLDAVITHACECFNITKTELTKKYRGDKMPTIRYIVMYLMRKITNESNQSISSILNLLNHSSTSTGIRSYHNLCGQKGYEWMVLATKEIEKQIFIEHVVNECLNDIEEELKIA